MAKRTVSGKIISVLLIAHVIVMGFSGFLNAYAEDSGSARKMAAGRKPHSRASRLAGN